MGKKKQKKPDPWRDYGHFQDTRWNVRSWVPVNIGEGKAASRLEVHIIGLVVITAVLLALLKEQLVKAVAIAGGIWLAYVLLLVAVGWSKRNESAQ